MELFRALLLSILGFIFLMTMVFSQLQISSLLLRKVIIPTLKMFTILTNLILETLITEKRSLLVRFSGTEPLILTLIFVFSTLIEQRPSGQDADGIHLMRTFQSSGEFQMSQMYKFATLWRQINTLRLVSWLLLCALSGLILSFARPDHYRLLNTVSIIILPILLFSLRQPSFSWSTTLSHLK